MYSWETITLYAPCRRDDDFLEEPQNEFRVKLCVSGKMSGAETYEIYEMISNHRVSSQIVHLVLHVSGFQFVKLNKMSCYHLTDTYQPYVAC